MERALENRPHSNRAIINLQNIWKKRRRLYKKMMVDAGLQDKWERNAHVGLLLHIHDTPF